MRTLHGTCSTTKAHCAFLSALWLLPLVWRIQRLNFYFLLDLGTISLLLVLPLLKLLLKLLLLILVRLLLLLLMLLLKL